MKTDWKAKMMGLGRNSQGEFKVKQLAHDIGSWLTGVALRSIAMSSCGMVVGAFLIVERRSGSCAAS